MFADDPEGEPQFPPLLNGIKVKGHPRPFRLARSRAEKGESQAGDFFWAPSERTLECAVVLEPETTTTRSMHMLFAAMVAFGDCFGALAPPEIGLFNRWPSTFIINEAYVGGAYIAVPDDVGDDEIPDWLVVGIKIELKGNPNQLNPGEDMSRTNLFEEGICELTCTRLVESFSRHMLVWIHTWNDEGFKPVYENWVGRAEGKGETITIEKEGESWTGTFLNIDDDGNMLLKTGENAADLICLKVRDFANTDTGK